jgi:hypothetical protein
VNGINIAREILADELGNRRVDLSRPDEVLAAAASLLQHSLTDRPVPRGPWEEAVLALAVAAKRVMAHVPEHQAITSLRVALDERAKRRAEASLARHGVGDSKIQEEKHVH